MGYRFDNSAVVGPNVGGNSSSGGINVGGNPNVQTAITSATSLLQNPLTLALLGVVVLGALWIWKGKR